MTKMQPLHDEHRELWPHVERIRAAAEAVGQAKTVSIRGRLDELLTFLEDGLIPHASAEERELYPTVERVMDAPQATATMRRDHVEVGSLVGQLREAREALTLDHLSDAQANELRRVLFGLYELLKVHFAKEEEIYLPLLEERLTEREAATLFSSMERAATEARASREPIR